MYVGSATLPMYIYSYLGFEFVLAVNKYYLVPDLKTVAEIGGFMLQFGNYLKHLL